MISLERMTTATEYQQRIATYNRSRLVDLWTQIQASDTPDWEPGKALEYNANQTILLWEGSEIEYALQHQSSRQGLIQKYRYCVERAVANYRIDLGDLP